MRWSTRGVIGALALASALIPLGPAASRGLDLEAVFIAAARGSPEAETLIRRMVDSAPHADFVGTQETTIFKPNYRTSRQRVTQKGGRRHIVYEAPPELKGKQIFSDGSHTLFSGGGVSVPDVGLGDDLGSLRKSAQGTETVAKRRAYVVELRPAGKSGASRRIWIDAEHYVPLRWEDSDASGNLVSKTVYTSIRFGGSVPAVVPPTQGIVKPGIDQSPALSLDEVGKRVGFRVQQPEYLPKGYRLKAASVTTIGKGNRAVRGATTIYTNDLGFIDLRQTPARAIGSTRPGPPRETPMGLVWVRDGFHFVLSATPPLSREEMAKIAESVR